MSSVLTESHVEQGGNGCVSVFLAAAVCQRLAAGHSSLIGRQFLLMLLSLPAFRIGMIITLCHISGICPVEVEDVSEIVDDI